jgi:hypothetical protein
MKRLIELSEQPALLLGILPWTLIAYLAAWVLAPKSFGALGFGLILVYLVLLAILWIPFGFWLSPSSSKNRPNVTTRQSLVAKRYLCIVLVLAAIIALASVPPEVVHIRGVAFIQLWLCAAWFGITFTGATS